MKPDQFRAAVRPLLAARIAKNLTERQLDELAKLASEHDLAAGFLNPPGHSSPLHAWDPESMIATMLIDALIETAPAALTIAPPSTAEFVALTSPEALGQAKLEAARRAEQMSEDARLACIDPAALERLRSGSTSSPPSSAPAQNCHATVDLDRVSHVVGLPVYQLRPEHIRKVQQADEARASHASANDATRAKALTHREAAGQHLSARQRLELLRASGGK